MSLPSVGHNIVIDLDKKTAQIINTKSDGSKNILTIFANSPDNPDGKFDVGDSIAFTDEKGRTVSSGELVDTRNFNIEFDTGVVANLLEKLKGKTPEQLSKLKEVEMSGVTFDPIKCTNASKGLMQTAAEINNRVKEQERIKEQNRLLAMQQPQFAQQSYMTNPYMTGYNPYATSYTPYGYNSYNALNYAQPVQNTAIGSYQNPYSSAGALGTYSNTLGTSSYDYLQNFGYQDYSISNILDSTDYSHSPLYRKYAKNPDMLFKIMELQQASQFNRLFNAHLNAEYNNPYTRWSAMYDFAHGDYGSICRYNRNQAMKRNAFMYASGGIHPYNAIYQTNARQAAIRNELARMGLSMYDLDYNFW